jgi:hypothetical protein
VIPFRFFRLAFLNLIHVERIRGVFSWVLVICTFNHAQAQLHALEILEKALKVHDPKHKWAKLDATFDMRIMRERTNDRYFSIYLNIPRKTFRYIVNTDSLKTEQVFIGSTFGVSLNESPQVSTQDSLKYDLTRARTQYLKEVYEYLMLLPMRLKNDLQFLAPTVTEESFNSEPCYKIAMLYEPRSESETWYFYISKSTFRLAGYQFFLKDLQKDGEYIYLSDYEWFKGLLIPKTKTWYWNKDRTFFRTDSVLGWK